MSAVLLLFRAGDIRPISIRSMQAHWMGGASNPIPIIAGCRSMLAFWMGGACGVLGKPAVIEEEHDGIRHRERIKLDDDEVMMLISMMDSEYD